MATFTAGAVGVDFDILDLGPLLGATPFGTTPTSVGLTVAEEPDLSKMPEANRRRYLTYRKMREIAERA